MKKGKRSGIDDDIPRGHGLVDVQSLARDPDAEIWIVKVPQSIEPKRLHDVCLFDSKATVKQSGKRFSGHIVKEESNEIAICSDQKTGHSVSLTVRGIVSLVENVSPPDATENIEALIEGADRPTQQQMKDRDPFLPLKQSKKRKKTATKAEEEAHAYEASPKKKKKKK